MKSIDQQLESVAYMLAAAYWRGRLVSLDIEPTRQSTLEAMIKAAANVELEQWKAAARIAVV